MSYDYHGAWDGVTGHNSPLYGRKGEPPESKYWNINSSMHIWMGRFFKKSPKIERSFSF